MRTERMLVSTVVALALFGIAGLIGGCGGGSSAIPLSERSIATDVKQLNERLVTPRDIERTRAGSLERAFLSYWRSVQFGEVASAEAAYEAGLRAAIGHELLASAIRNSSPTYRVQTPTVADVHVTGDDAVVRYLATPGIGGAPAAPASMAWTRTPSGWRILHNPALDAQLKDAAQSREQLRVTSSQSLDPRAVRAGELAAGLQAKYLRRIGRVPGSAVPE